MANYVPKYANNAIDLKCFQKTDEPVIVCTDKEFFIQLDKKVSGNKLARKTKSVSTNGLIIGGVLSLFTGGLGLVVLGASALGTIAGIALDQFKDYKAIMDYSEKRVIFIKVHGTNCFNENFDTIEGIDLNHILLHSKQ